ncbi:hormogonium polysaccharide biosynthesis acetyltransferase HpsU [Geitlerinema sp. PCC 9228]|jgi:putative colanic acid biosynthesis acetyltransferase WcaF|uniref:hormogonium polysaccharide biosynthesis acetyltransferase HpsU n=1 Tax=Geitlerinema sp. PCC 9228 TaxID=111611 RepID=UPI000A05DA46|nr:hormogonium polysaccharide biosynthesis acetyltransferase HpsU [Geitlerinema sp. PCC 9228]
MAKIVSTNFDRISQADIDTTSPAKVDLSQYDQSWYDRGRPAWLVFWWWLVQAIAFPLSPHPWNGFRSWLLRRFGAKIGKQTVIRPTVRVTYPWKVKLGDYSWLGDDVVLYSLDHISIGDHCVISQESYLCTGSHDLSDRYFHLMVAPITIGNGVWVASDCFVGPGVQIGSNTTIGARSSVFKNIPAGYVAWGTPCKPMYPRPFREASPGSPTENGSQPS